MSIRRLLFALASAAAVAACSEEVSPLEQICTDEIVRKVADSDMTIDSSEISGTSKDDDGNLVLLGMAQLTQGVEKKSIQFSCIMQGEGQAASIVRVDIDYDAIAPSN